MAFELVLAGYLMAVGMSVAGAATHLYQWRSGQPAALRAYGRTRLGTLGCLALSFVCGPYLTLQLGWRHEGEDVLAYGPVLIAALVAFTWSFVTGLLFVGIAVALVH